MLMKASLRIEILHAVNSACIVTKRKKLLQIFRHLKIVFFTPAIVDEERPLSPEISAKSELTLQKMLTITVPQL